MLSKEKKANVIMHYPLLLEFKQFTTKNRDKSEFTHDTITHHLTSDDDDNKILINLKKLPSKRNTYRLSLKITDASYVSFIPRATIGLSSLGLFDADSHASARTFYVLRENPQIVE